MTRLGCIAADEPASSSKRNCREDHPARAGEGFSLKHNETPVPAWLMYFSKREGQRQGFERQTLSTRMVKGMPEATENWHTTMRPWLGNLLAALSPR